MNDWETGDQLDVFTRMEFVFTIPTNEPASRLVERLDAFLRTSQWGEWTLQDGDHVRRRYRRGKWVRKGLFGPLVGDERMPGDSLFWSMEAVKAANRDGFKSYPSWPLLLDASFRPLADAFHVRLIFDSGLEPRRKPFGIAYDFWMDMSSMIDSIRAIVLTVVLRRPERDEWKLQRDERRRVATHRYLNYVVKCVRDEAHGVVAYLTAAYGLSGNRSRPGVAGA